MKKRTLTILIAAVLVVACAVGGTLAWLKAQTPSVVNTFTDSNIEISLTETKQSDGTDKETSVAWSAQMVPGYSYSKNPIVSVTDYDVDCYLFVKFEEIGNPSTYLDYTSTLTNANGWTQVDTNANANVWYRIVPKGVVAENRTWHLLANDSITVKSSVTKENMEQASAAQLKYTAYAVQRYKEKDVEFSVSDAWQAAQGLEISTQ